MAFFLFSGSFSFAQTNFALKGGPNTSTALVSVNDLKQQNQYLNGFNIGAQLETFFDNQLYFTPSIMYSRRGFSYKSSPDTSSYKYVLNYIDINPTLIFYLNKKHLEKGFAIMAGPYISVGLTGKGTSTVDNVTSTQNVTYSMVSGFCSVDLGVNGGLCWKFNRFFMEAMYQYGFANINNNVDSDGRNFQNRMISFNIGYFLTHNK
jgi:hypothetical protein